MTVKIYFKNYGRIANLIYPEQHKLVDQPLSNIGQPLINRCPIDLCCSGYQGLIIEIILY